MQDEWVVVYTSSILYDISLRKGLLESQNIPAIILNQQDSAYLSIGEIELHVKKQDYMRAKYLIDSKSSD